MAQTLKERYENKRSRTLNNSQLNEAIDQDELKQASDTIKRLRELTQKFPIKELTVAINKIMTDVNDFVSKSAKIKQGGNFFKRMQNKRGDFNPINGALAFADALETGFSQVRQILENNDINIEKLNKNPKASLADYFQLKSPADKEKNELKSKNFNNIKIQLEHALALPNKSSFFKFFKIEKYLDVKAFVITLVTMPLVDFSNIVKEISKIPHVDIPDEHNDKSTDPSTPKQKDIKFYLKNAHSFDDDQMKEFMNALTKAGFDPSKFTG